MRSNANAPEAFYLSPDDPPAKRAILQAALRRFVRDGLCETSIRTIAADAGYTNPALFKHFDSKEALALYLFEQCYRRYAVAIGVAVRPAAGFATNVRAVLERFAELYDEDPNAFLFLNDNLRHFWPQVAPALRRQSMVAHIAALIRAGQAAGEVRRDVDVRLLVAAVTGLLAQVARLLHFGELRGRARDQLAGLEALVLGMAAR